MYLRLTEGDPYRQYLLERRLEAVERLIKERDTVKSDRLRGEIELLDCLISLPVVIDDYLRGVSENKYNRITDPLKVPNREELQNVR